MPGIRAVALQSWPNGGGHPRPEDDIFWAATAGMGVPLTFHFSFGAYQDEKPAQQEGNWPPVSTLLTRVDTNAGTAVCCTRIIGGGVFDRFASLRFSIAEFGHPGFRPTPCRPISTTTATATTPVSSCRTSPATTSATTSCSGCKTTTWPSASDTSSAWKP